MTEWDKMQQHQIYNDFDADLFDLRVEAKKVFWQQETRVV